MIANRSDKQNYWFKKWNKSGCYFIVTLVFTMPMLAQDFCRESCPIAQQEFHTNRVSGTISTGGDLFFEEPYQNTGFGFHVDDTTIYHTVYLASLIMAGVTSDGDFRSAYKRFDRSAGRSVYTAGPLALSPIQDSINQQNWDRIWQVSAAAIYLHLQEIASHGMPLVRRKELYDYPAKGNPYFTNYNNFTLPENSILAPFFDANQDSIYNPDDGDYPLPHGVHSTAIPDLLYWAIFNASYDFGNIYYHPLDVEVELITFAYDCATEPVINRTLFTQYAITNKGVSLDSFRIGTFADMQISHPENDYFGTAVDLNTAYVYNSTPTDEHDFSYYPQIKGNNLPVQSLTYLNNSMDHTIIHYETNAAPAAGVTSPGNALQLHHNMSGRWIDGVSLTRGGNGRFSSDTITTHMFPDNPNDSVGWSMPFYPELDIRSISAHRVEEFAEGETIYFDKAWTYHQAENGDHLSNVDLMYEQIPLLQEMYDNGFANISCLISNINELPKANPINIFPNPATDFITIESTDVNVDKVEIYDSNGRLVLASKQMEIDLTKIPQGIYFIKINTQNGDIFMEKVVRL